MISKHEYLTYEIIERPSDGMGYRSEDCDVVLSGGTVDHKETWIEPCNAFVSFGNHSTTVGMSVLLPIMVLLVAEIDSSSQQTKSSGRFQDSEYSRGNKSILVQYYGW